MDIRKEKNLGTFTNKKGTYTFEIPQDLNAVIQSEFNKDNKTKGNRDLVFVLEDIHVSDFDNGKKVVPAGHIRSSIFEKKGDKYYFLSSMDKNAGTPDVQAGMTPNYLDAFITLDIQNFIRTSYSKTPSSVAISENDLPNYYSILSSALPAFNQTVAEGVYENAQAFFYQKPSAGFKVEKNDEGKVTRAKNGDQKIPGSKIWAYVEDGKIYKNTFSGYIPMEKDEKGYYLTSNRGELEMVAANNTLGMFGLIGGVAGAIEQNARQNKAKKADKYRVYIDPLTGAYIY